jgi:hypothetical protein
MVPFGLDSFAPQSNGCVGSVQTMQVETKFLRLCQPAALGEQIDGWKVYWVGGWGRDRLFFYVMVARAEEQNSEPALPSRESQSRSARIRTTR